MTTQWSTINTSGTMKYRTFKIQKWQTSFNFNLWHLIFMIESWLALLTAVPLVSFDIGLAVIFRKAGIGFLVPNRDITENLFVVCDKSLENLAHLWSFSTSKLFAVRFSLGRKSIPTNPVDTSLCDLSYWLLCDNSCWMMKFYLQNQSRSEVKGHQKSAVRHSLQQWACVWELLGPFEMPLYLELMRGKKG